MLWPKADWTAMLNKQLVTAMQDTIVSTLMLTDLMLCSYVRLMLILTNLAGGVVLVVLLPYGAVIGGDEEPSVDRAFVHDHGVLL